jgi:thiamine-phosphate pyrophosphorylase
MIRCAITDGASSCSGLASRGPALASAASRWAADRIDFIQLREKHIPAGALVALAQSMLAALRASAPEDRAENTLPRTRLLINSRADVALAAGADGVHLTSGPDELTPAQVRRLFVRAGLAPPVVSISCHTLAELRRATAAGVDLILFGPVFEKRVRGELVTDGLGLEALGEGCRLAAPTPVLALGGITAANAPVCLQAGAAGIAGIRLFASGESPARPISSNMGVRK